MDYESCAICIELCELIALHELCLVAKFLLELQSWGRVKTDSIACAQSDVNPEIDPTNRAWCYLLSNSNRKEEGGDENSTRLQIFMMRTQLTGFPLWAVDIWWRGFGGERIGIIGGAAALRVPSVVCSMIKPGQGGNNQISKCARHCLSIYAATSRQSDTIGRDRNCIGVCHHIWSSVSL